MKDDPCPACGGRRLKPASLAVTYRGLSIGSFGPQRGRSIEFLKIGRSAPGAGVLDAKSAAVTAAVRGDPPPSPPPQRRRPGLSPGRPPFLHALGRRGPADPAGRPARRQAHRGHLRPRRADAGPSSTGHGRSPRLIRELTAEATPSWPWSTTDVIRAADFVIDLGPGAGREGGLIVAEGTPADIEANPSSVTGPYLRSLGTVPEPLTGTAGPPKSPGPGLTTSGTSTSRFRRAS